jgi:hypothetical protein
MTTTSTQEEDGCGYIARLRPLLHSETGAAGNLTWASSGSEFGGTKLTSGQFTIDSQTSTSRPLRVCHALSRVKISCFGSGRDINQPGSMSEPDLELFKIDHLLCNPRRGVVLVRCETEQCRM